MGSFVCYDSTMTPTVYMMLGLPGSGKTTFSKKIEKEKGITRFSLDEEYAKLGGDLKSYQWDELIAKRANDLIKSHIQELVGQNKSIILDFCPWKKSDRSQYLKFIESIGAKYHIYYLEVPTHELKKRLANRNNNLSANEHAITSDMLNTFMTRFDPPTDERFESIQS